MQEGPQRHIARQGGSETDRHKDRRTERKVICEKKGSLGIAKREGDSAKAKKKKKKTAVSHSVSTERRM